MSRPSEAGFAVRGGASPEEVAAVTAVLAASAAARAGRTPPTGAPGEADAASFAKVWRVRRRAALHRTPERA